jgi:hypothetical protein
MKNQPTGRPKQRAKATTSDTSMFRRRWLSNVFSIADTPAWLRRMPRNGSSISPVCACVQPKGQIDRSYGRDADNLLTNHRSKLLYPSATSDLATIEYFRNLIGDEHIRSDLDERRGCAGADRHRDRCLATTVPFLAPNVLRQVKVGDALLVHGALPPAWIKAPRRRRR